MCPSLPSSPPGPHDPKKPLGLHGHREKIFQDISREANVPIEGATRQRMEVIQKYIIQFGWPNMTNALLSA